jgi:hypothetical protein
MSPLKDEFLEGIKARFRAEIRNARRAGYSAAFVLAALEASRVAVERELEELRWREALKAATGPQTASLATKIRLAWMRARESGAELATLKIQPARVVAALALLRAAGFEVIDEGTARAHGADFAPDVRVLSFRLPVGAAGGDDAR